MIIFGVSVPMQVAMMTPYGGCGNSQV